MKLQNPDKPTSQVLDLFFQRAKDLQSFFGNAYDSPILHRDCTVRGVKDEDFYFPLIDSNVPTDLIELHTRRYQCIGQYLSASVSFSTTSCNVYRIDGDNKNVEAKYQLYYASNGSPVLKRKIMRGSSSCPSLDQTIINRQPIMGNVADLSMDVVIYDLQIPLSRQRSFR